MDNLTIVTSCSGYGRYLREWATSIVRLNRRPGAVCIFTHGATADRDAGAEACRLLRENGFDVVHEHVRERLDFGTARNRAVELSRTEWVMHLDCDDTILPHAVDDIAALAPDADVIPLGYERVGDLRAGPSMPRCIYKSSTGLEALDLTAPASGVSPFRRALWEQRPYQTNMLGAWDTALWIGFARLGARFRATKRPCFHYRQHADSVFNRRRLTLDWTHALTGTQLRNLRRDYQGVAVVVPVDPAMSRDRAAAWSFVRTHYQRAHPSWPVVEGVCRSEDWVKGRAIQDALEWCTARVLVVADADCLVAPDALAKAVRLVESGAVPWMVPHRYVKRLDATLTHELVTGALPPFHVPEARITASLARAAYEGYAGGGIFVVRRDVYDAVGGIPQAFRGWGGEDEAMAIILDTLAGAHARGLADLFHLWHEPQESKLGRERDVNAVLLRRVRDAARRGVDTLWRELETLSSGHLPAATVKATREWKRRIKEQSNRFRLEDRQAYLATRARERLKQRFDRRGQ